MGAVYNAQMIGTADIGGDYPAIVPMMPPGEKALCLYPKDFDDSQKCENSLSRINSIYFF